MDRIQLILVDGLPGSGKSTAAQFIAAHLQKSNIPSKWYIEEDADHPVHSRQFKRKHVSRNDFADKCLQNWYNFAQTVIKSNQIIILDGSIFQSSVRFLLEYDSSIHDIKMYFSKFEDIIFKLDPLLIYFYQSNVDAFLRKTIEMRGSEWSSKVENYITSTPYAIRNNLQGIEGHISFWESYRIICDDLFNTTKITKMSFENSARNWKSYYQEIKEYLNRNITKLWCGTARDS